MNSDIITTGIPFFDEPYQAITKAFETLKLNIEHHLGRSIPCRLVHGKLRRLCLRYALRLSSEIKKTDSQNEKRVKQAVILSSLIARLKPVEFVSKKLASIEKVIQRINAYLAFDVFAVLLPMNLQGFALSSKLKLLKPKIIASFHSGDIGEAEMLMIGELLIIDFPPKEAIQG